MCMLSEWLPMAGNWCRGFHRGIGGTGFFLNFSSHPSLTLCHIGTQQKYTHLFENTTGIHPCTCTHIHTQVASLVHKSPYMHMHTGLGWLRSDAEETLSVTVQWLLVFPAEYKPLAHYSLTGRKPAITNAKSEVITCTIKQKIFHSSRNDIPFLVLDCATESFCKCFTSLPHFHVSVIYSSCTGESILLQYWSGNIIGIVEISMWWWMIDNATTAIDQCNTADKTLVEHQFAFTTQFAGSLSDIYWNTNSKCRIYPI